MEINEHLIKRNSEIRRSAREQLKGNWGTAILLCLIYALISGLFSGSTRVVPYLGMIINFILAGPLILGLYSCFIKLVRQEPFRFENLFDGFSRFTTAFIAQLLITIFVILWSLLLLIPGIIAGLRYSMTFYIINDNPDISAMDALNASKEMMVGFKWKLFCLYLSFLGWAILSIFTLGIGYLWLMPYIQASFANFYQNLKDAYVGKIVI